jgi:voltage-gated potassium channel
MRILLGVILIIAVGVAGIRFFEGYSFFGALWYVIEALTTTGSSDITPVTLGGKIFIMLLRLIGISFVLYAVSYGVALVVEGRLSDLLGRRKMEKIIAKMENHVIICGAGRVGSEVIYNLKHDQVPFVVIESSPSAIQEFQAQNLPIIEGDATNDDILVSAGIGNARGIIAALPSDADNVFISLTAKELNPAITVVARANRRDSESKLLRAGADKVVAPEALGGHRMAVSILRPAAVKFVDTIMNKLGKDIEIEEITVSEDSILCNLTMRQAAINEKTGATVVSIMRHGEIIGVPGANEPIKPFDVLISFGQREQLDKLEKLAVDCK